MASGSGSSPQSTSAMSIDELNRPTNSHSQTHPGPRDEPAEVQAAPATLMEPSWNAVAGSNVVGRLPRTQSIDFLLNAHPQPRSTPPAGFSGYHRQSHPHAICQGILMPQDLLASRGVAQPSSGYIQSTTQYALPLPHPTHGLRSPWGVSDRNNLPLPSTGLGLGPWSRQDRTSFMPNQAKPPPTGYRQEAFASPGGRSIHSEHSSYWSPPSFAGGPPNWRTSTTPSALSVTSYSPTTPFTPKRHRYFCDTSPSQGESRRSFDADVHGEASHAMRDNMELQMLPPTRFGYVERTEVYSGTNGSHHTPNDTFRPEIEAKHAFESADRRKKGQLDFREFLEAIRSLNVSLAHHEAQACFMSKLDRNKDGFITEEEFVNGYLNHKFSLTPRS